MAQQTSLVGGTSPRRVRFVGRVLVLTEDPELIRRQLAGEDIAWEPGMKLRDNISTDEITPGWVCFNYDEKLGRYVYIGLKGGPVKENEVAGGGFVAVVSGKSKGCGSSRENSPYAEYWAGIRVVIAESLEKIYGQNCHNIGLLTSTDFSLIDRIRRGEELALDEFTGGLDPISRDIVEAGNLFAYNVARSQGAIAVPAVTTSLRPLNLVEKIIARNLRSPASPESVGVPAVQAGDAGFVRVQLRFSHEYVTPMAEWAYRRHLDATPLKDPGSVYFFRDHLIYLPLVMPEEHRKLGLLEKAEGLGAQQKKFAGESGVKLYDSVAICHNAVFEDLALPGGVVVGTDSHTCMAGALGCFAFGVGTTDMANAWFTQDVRVKVPETVKFVLVGRKHANVTAKDIMLQILATDYIKNGKGIGQVMEFAGPGLRDLDMDERATLANMSVEAGGFTGIVEPDDITVDYLVKQRGMSREAVQSLVVKADPGAVYAEVFTIDLTSLEPMLALPGDPRNGIPMSAMNGEIKIDIAYGGSCTGGKKADMDMYAAVLKQGLAAGKSVAPGVHFYLQFGSVAVKRYAEEQGYIDIFKKAGAELLDPGCGACIRAGPGVSMTPTEVTISSQNRNFPGRSGPGQVYLASPLTVAASALAGHIVPPPEG